MTRRTVIMGVTWIACLGGSLLAYRWKQYDYAFIFAFLSIMSLKELEE
jgi:hypothetical protein